MSINRTMTVQECLSALRKAPKVYVWVKASIEDGCYFRAIKTDVIYRLKYDLLIEDGASEVLAYVDKETGTLYIN